MDTPAGTPLLPGLEPNDLYYFAVIVESGSFTAAGRRLGMPKSRLSRHLAELEESLGARLLQRTTRRMSLTEIGHQVLEHAQAMRVEVQAAIERVLAGSASPWGKIRVASPVLLGQLVLTRLVPEFLHLHPHVSLELELANRRVDLVAEGFDIALEATSHAARSPNLVRRTLGRTRPILVASPRLVERLGTPASVPDLDRYPALVMFTQDGRHSLRFEGAGGTSARVRVSPSLVCSDLSLLLASAEAGVGMAVLPELLCGHSLLEHRLVRLLPGWEVPARSIHALHFGRKAISLAARTFLDFLAARVPPLIAPRTPSH